MSLYLALNIGVLSIPFALSYDKKVHFYTLWKYLIPSMAITLAVFTTWDVFFTRSGIWGFNERYLLGRELFGLPLEEYLFFITVPYASVFTIHVIRAYFPRFRFTISVTRIVTWVLVGLLLLIALLNLHRTYTAVSFIFSALLLGWVYASNRKILRQFYIGYLVILIPFLVVNGILTGSFIEEQVVWYNDNENLGIRLATIPVEDIFYGMSLILMNYFLLETFRKRRSAKG